MCACVYVCMCMCTHVCTYLCSKVVALENHSCSRFLNTGKSSFGLNGGGLVAVHMLVLAQGPSEAFVSNKTLTS